MRIVVIGETGQLARRLAASQAGHDLTFLGRDRLDLARPETIEPALAQANPEMIVNAAAYTAVDAAEDDRDAAYAINAEGPAAAAAAAEAAGIPFIHVSTDYVYDGSKDGPYMETDPVAPLSVYGKTKLAGERMVAAACPRHAIVRTAWVYAPEGKNFVKTMLQLGAERDVVRVVDDQRGSPTYAGDLADAILAMAPHLAASNAGDPAFGIFHYAGGGATSWAGFAEVIFDCASALGLIRTPPWVERIATSEFPTKAVRPANSVLDCSRIARLHGVVPRAWREGLKDMLSVLAR